MKGYTPRYVEWLEKAAVDDESLPAALLTLIEKFENAMSAWRQAEAAIQQELLPVLVKTDAVIAAHIYGLHKERLETEPVDKVKLMALKAKALQLKRKQQS